MKYVILAAGLGSRFAKNGEKKPKPLVEIEGQPMIGRLIDILMKHGGEQINIVANSRMTELVEYLEDLKAKGYPLVVRPIISDNSYYPLFSVQAVIDAILVTGEVHGGDRIAVDHTVDQKGLFLLVPHKIALHGVVIVDFTLFHLIDQGFRRPVDIESLHIIIAPSLSQISFASMR